MFGLHPVGDGQPLKCFQEEMVLALFSKPLTLNSDRNKLPEELIKRKSDARSRSQRRLELSGQHI